jgi:uncharacterized protein (TIGR04255 family)
MAQYKRAPITEAVIEIRTRTLLQGSELERLVARFAKKYPAEAQKLFDISMQVGEAASASKVNQTLNGYRLSSLDGTRLLNLGLQAISTARLAPYEGWERFVEEARANWDIWLKVVDWQPLSRIGVRYINRIDIPTMAKIALDDYFTFLPQMPKTLDNGIEHFAMNVLVPLGKDDLKVVLNAGSTQSPLIGHQSLILDLDVALNSNLPKEEAGLWAFIDRMRDRKNEVFETCITDKTRALLI